jgi:hypothetical protein
MGQQMGADQFAGAASGMPSDVLMGGAMPSVAATNTGGPGGSQSGMMSALASGFSKLSEVSSFLGSSPDEIKKNAQVLGAMAKDLGSAHQAMTDSTLMRRVIEHGMRAPLAVFGGQSPQAAARIQPTFSGEAAAQAGQWRGMR